MLLAFLKINHENTLMRAVPARLDTILSPKHPRRRYNAAHMNPTNPDEQLAPLRKRIDELDPEKPTLVY